MKKTAILITIFWGFMAMVGCGKKNDGEEIIQPTVTYEVSSNSSDVSKNNIEAKEETAISENDGKPAYYDTYAKLLFQFMTDSSCCFLSDFEAFPYNDSFLYMLKDLNKDGREELIVGYRNSSYIEWNLLVPADTWEEANLGSFTKYDEATGIFALEYGDVGGGTDYYSLKENQLELVDKYEYDVYDGVDTWNGTKYYHLTTDGTRNEISEEEYLQQPSEAWKAIEGEWIKLTPTSLSLLSDINFEVPIDIDMSSPITVSQYDQRIKGNDAFTQKEYTSVSEFITSNGFDEGKPFYKYRSISEKTQMLLYYDENTEIGCVVLEKDSWLEGYSFVGVTSENNEYGIEKIDKIKREYNDPFNVSDRMDIYSTEFVENLQEEKKTDKNENIIYYCATGKVIGAMEENDDTVVSVECEYDKNNVLRHRAFFANPYIYGTSETPKNTTYDSKGRVEYVDYYMTSGTVYDYYIYSADNENPQYNLNIDFGVASLNVY